MNGVSFKFRNSDSYLLFRNVLLRSISPTSNSFFNIYNPAGIKFLTSNFSHLNDYKFKHNFENDINPFCTWSQKTETATHFFLCCRHCSNIHHLLLKGLKSINENIVSLPENLPSRNLLFGDSSYTLPTNKNISNASINYIRFS